MLILFIVIAGSACIAILVKFVRSRSEARSINEYERAMDRLRDMSHLEPESHSHENSNSPDHPQRYARVVLSSSATHLNPPSPSGPPSPPSPSGPSTTDHSVRHDHVRPVVTSSTRSHANSELEWGKGLKQLDAQSRKLDSNAPRLIEEVARILGIFDEPEKRDARVESNARLTGTTGLLLTVLFFLEGITIPFIVRLLSWHIIIGLVLIPPVLLKIGSTSWKFANYYLGNDRYRQAGPPHPLLRVLGPLVMGSTVAVIASGVALWLSGPGPQSFLLLRIHQVTFVLWFGFVAIHLVSHLLRATRYAAADSRDSREKRPSIPGAKFRRRIVLASLLVGLLIGVGGRSISTGWTSSPRITHVTPTVKK